MKKQRPQLSDEFFQVPKKEKTKKEHKKIKVKLTKKQIVIFSVVLCLIAVIVALNRIKVPIDYSYIEETFHIGCSDYSGVFFAARYPGCAVPISGYDSKYDVIDEKTGTVYESYYASMEISLWNRIFVPDGYYVLNVYQYDATDFQFSKDGTYLYGDSIHKCGLVGRIYYRDGDGTDHLIWENEALADIEE